VQHCYKPTPSHRLETIAPRKWSLLSPGRVLVNVDAALFDDLQHMAAGMVVRDHLGLYLLTASELFPSFTSPELAELSHSGVLSP
jgi:hypothetical protein